MNLVELTKEYFVKFSNKDVDSLSEMFSDDIVLIDWEVNKTEKQNVLNFNKTIFDSVDKLSVEPLLLVNRENTVFAEIIVRINDTTSLNVVDVITFDSKNKIKRIVAYKR